MMMIKPYYNEESATAAARDFECENPAGLDKTWEASLPLRTTDL
jgi:hypothetical protein